MVDSYDETEAKQGILNMYNSHSLVPRLSLLEPGNEATARACFYISLESKESPHKAEFEPNLMFITLGIVLNRMLTI